MGDEGFIGDLHQCLWNCLSDWEQTCRLSASQNGNRNYHSRNSLLDDNLGAFEVEVETNLN